MPYTQPMFSTTFRIMESLDEHFYAQDVYFNFNYHWPLHGFGLPEDILRKMYRESALSLHVERPLVGFLHRAHQRQAEGT